MKKIGRPKILENGKNRTLYLDQVSIDMAKKYGDGNVSSGIRKSLDLLELSYIVEILTNLASMEQAYKDLHSILLTMDSSPEVDEMLCFVEQNINELKENIQSINIIKERLNK